MVQFLSRVLPLSFPCATALSLLGQWINVGVAPWRRWPWVERSPCPPKQNNIDYVLGRSTGQPTRVRSPNLDPMETLRRDGLGFQATLVCKPMSLLCENRGSCRCSIKTTPWRLGFTGFLQHSQKSLMRFGSSQSSSPVFLALPWSSYFPQSLPGGCPSC